MSNTVLEAAVLELKKMRSWRVEDLYSGPQTEEIRLAREKARLRLSTATLALNVANARRIAEPHNPCKEIVTTLEAAALELIAAAEIYRCEMSRATRCTMHESNEMKFTWEEVEKALQ